MCKRCDDMEQPVHSPLPGDDRRAFLKGALAAGAVATVATLAQEAVAATGEAAKTVRTVGLAKSAIDKPFERFEFRRRSPGADDVLIDILYCGVCHTDIHFLDGSFGPLRSTLVPGHEMVGRVREVGASVSRFKVGDLAGVGTMIDSCGTCRYCRAGLEPYCQTGFTPTYGVTPTGVIQGGYASNIVVKERFALKIDPRVNLAATAPLLCAGITTYSPMRYWDIKQGKKVAIVGFGGLGHVALKLAVDAGAETSIFSTTPGKRDAAMTMGAQRFFEWNSASDFPALRNEFDYILSTVPAGYDMGIFLPLLAVDGTLSNVGTLGLMEKPLNNGLLLGGRRRITGSAVGGIAETQQLLDHCAARNIAADIELIGPDRINEAFRRVAAKDVRFRFVLDMARFA